MISSEIPIIDIIDRIRIATGHSSFEIDLYFGQTQIIRKTGQERNVRIFYGFDLFIVRDRLERIRLKTISSPFSLDYDHSNECLLHSFRLNNTW